MVKMDPKGKLILDANIIIGAVFGPRRWRVLEHPNFKLKIDICCPVIIMEEVDKNVPEIAHREGTDMAVWRDSLASLKERVTVFPYQHMHRKEAAQARLAGDARETNDWQVVVLALHLGCGIFSHDKDFWGSGIPVWSIDTVERCLERGGLEL
ncbi:MAG: hypothetical protein F4040_09625 [Synechococcus sp. SB0670_bin_20]|nr:hypothetical protein [Synechococcus sp. SB0670_bin_20]